MTDLVEELIAHYVRVDSVEEVAGLPPETESIFLGVLTDELALALTRLPQLRAVTHSGNSSLTDAGAGALANITTLEVLSLEWCTHISDVALVALERLTRLRWLDLCFCFRLSEEAIAALSQALPSCQVETHAR